jgi:hypothetical protein
MRLAKRIPFLRINFVLNTNEGKQHIEERELFL